MRRLHEVLACTDPGSDEEGDIEGGDGAMRPSGEYRLGVRSRDVQRLRDRDVSEVMGRSACAVASDWSVSDVRRIARTLGARHLVVVPRSVLRAANDGGRLAGGRALRRADVLGVLSHHDLDDAHPDTTVSEHMSQPAVVVGIAVSLECAANVMRTRGVGALPVVDEGRIAGIVTRDDLRDAGVPEPELEPSCCVSCSSRRQLQVDFLGRGMTVCRDCADRSVEAIPYEEMGVGD